MSWDPPLHANGEISSYEVWVRQTQLRRRRATCADLSSNECFSDEKCALDQDSNLCRDKQCRDFFDQTGCEGSGLCEYDGSNFVCFIKGEQPLCSQLFDASSCGDRSDCEYVTDAFLCKVKGSKTPCRVFFEQGTSCASKCLPLPAPPVTTNWPTIVVVMSSVFSHEIPCLFILTVYHV